jgi:hypothetical protein
MFLIYFFTAKLIKKGAALSRHWELDDIWLK